MSETTFARPAMTSPGVAVLLRLFALPVLGAFCFGVIAMVVPSDRLGLVGITLATATLILMVVAFDRSRPRERRNLLLTIFSFSYAVFFVVPVFVFYVGEVGYIHEVSPNPSPIPLTPFDVQRGVLAAFLGYALLLVGFALPFGGVVAKLVPRMRREWSPEIALLVALVTIPLGWSVQFAGQFGLLSSRIGTGVLGTLASGTSFGIGLIALCYQRYRSPTALLLLIVTIPPTMFFNFFTSSKMLFVMPIVMIVMVHVIVTRRLRAWWIVGFLVLMALFYPIAVFYREYMFSRNLRAVQVIANAQQVFTMIANFATSFDPADYFRSGLDATFRRLDGVGILSVIVRDTPGRVPFQGGWSLAYIPMGYIPRILWPGKPQLIIGGWITATYGYGPHIESSTGCTWMGELYFNFGWTGILIGMTLIGVWFRFLQDYFLGIDATIPAMLAGIVTLLTLSSHVGGDLLSSVNTVVFTITPIVLTHLVVRSITPPPARPPPPL